MKHLVNVAMIMNQSSKIGDIVKIKLFDSFVEIKDITCGMNGNPGLPYTDTRLNLYTCLSHVCNTNCPFCIYNYKDDESFDFEKWKVCVTEIVKTTGIFKASFTGGEPSLDIERLVKCLDYLKSVDSKIFTIINTNGSNLEKLKGIKSLDNIALSRHSMHDDENFELFGNKNVPTKDIIANFPEKEKLHLSCNLIKGYVDSFDKIIDYLEECSKLGVRDVGFVSLMPVNDYAREHQIDFSDIPIKVSNRFIINQYFDRMVEDKCVCKCRNYMYLANNGNVVTAYSRYFVDRNYSDGTLVFMDNKLKQGFTGSVIY